MHLPSDDQQVALMDRIASGDAAALGEFASVVGPWVVAALRRMLQDDEVVDALTDRTFLEIWQMAPLWDRHVGRPLLWSLAIARAFAVEVLDQRRRDRLSGPGAERPADPGAARDESCPVGALLTGDPATRDVLEAAWFSHPVAGDSIVLVDAELLGPALQSFGRRLIGGADGG